MPGVRKIIVEESHLFDEIKALVKARRYHVVSIWLAGSKRHAQHSLPSDRMLVVAYRVKDIQRKKKEGAKDDTKQKPS